METYESSSLGTRLLLLRLLAKQMNQQQQQSKTMDKTNNGIPTASPTVNDQLSLVARKISKRSHEHVYAAS